MEILNYKKMFASQREVGDRKSEVEENQVNLKQIYTINLECEAIAGILAYNLCLKVLEDPKESYICALNAHKKYLSARSANVRLMLKNALQVVIIDMKNSFERTYLSTIEQQSGIVGLSTFIGLLYDKHLVDGMFIYVWIEEVLKPKYLHVSRLNMLQVIKKRVKMSIENGDMSNVTAKLNKAILDANLYEDENHEILIASKEQIKEFNRQTKRVSDKNPHDIYTKCVNSSHVYLNQAKKFLDFIINEPQDMSIYVEVNELLCDHNQHFGDEFQRLVSEKFFNTRDRNIIYLLWSTKFVAELGLMSSSDLSKFILPLADNLMYKSEGSTIVFMLIFWKLSPKLKQNSPEAYQQCLNYVKQIDLKIIKGVDDSRFFNGHASDDYFSLHISLDYKLKVDEFSLNRAKSIFNSAFLHPEYIDHTASRFGNSIADRLLRVHLEYLTEVKFYSVGIFQLMQFLKTAAKLYEHDFVTNAVIGKIMKALAIDCNVEALEYFCHQISDKAKEDTDQSFNDFKQHILQVTKPYDICTPQTYYDHLMDLINGQTSTNDFDYNNIQNFHLKEYTATFTLEAICKAELRELAPEICSKFQEAHPQFRNILTDFLHEYIEAMFWEQCESLNLATKMEPCAAFIGVLRSSEFLEKDSKLAEKIVKKCRSFCQTYRSNSESLMVLSRIISAEFFDEYVKTLDFFYEINEEKKLSVEVKKSLQRHIDEFLSKTNKTDVANANPSFKYSFGSLQSFNDVVSLRIINHHECAIYLLTNATQFNRVDETFRILMKLSAIEDENFKEDLKMLMAETKKRCDKIFFEQHLQQKGYGSDVQGTTLQTSLFAIELYLKDFITLNDVQLYTELIMNGIVISLNDVNFLCFETMLESLKENFERAFLKRVTTFHEIVIKRKLQQADYVEVSSRPLQFSQLKQKKPDQCIQMLIDSLFKITQPTGGLFFTYRQFYGDIINRNPIICEKFIDKMIETVTFYVLGTLIQLLNWLPLRNCGYFIAFIADSIKGFDLLDWFLTLLCDHILKNNDSHHQQACLDLAQLYMSLASKIPALSESKNVRKIHQFLMNMSELDDSYQEVCSDFVKLFNKTLNDEVCPSFRIYLQRVLQNNNEGTIEIVIVNPEKSAKLFLECAISRPFTRACDFAKEIELLKPKNPLGPDDPEVTVAEKLIIEVFKCIKKDFKEFELRGATDARPSVGLTMFICELFKAKMLSMQEFFSYAKRMKKVALRRPTKCHAMCFLNFYRVCEVEEELTCHNSFINMINDGNKELEKFDLSNMKFSDDVLDSLDCVNVLKLKPASTNFNEFLTITNDESFIIDEFDYKSLQPDHLEECAEFFAKKTEGFEKVIMIPDATKSAELKQEVNSSAVKQQNETEGSSENTKKKRKRRKHKKTKTNEGETSSGSNDVEESPKTEESTEDDIKQQDSVEEPPTEEEPHSPFEIDTFRLFIRELQFFTHDELIERVKMIEIESKQCLRVMSRELLSEFSLHYDINFVEIATTIDENLKVKPEIEKSFKETLADEIVRILKAKLSEGFDFDAILIDFDDEQQDPAPEPSQVQSDLFEIQSEVKKVKNLVKISLELFIADWIAQEKLENLLDSLTAGKNLKNLKVVTEIIKMTAQKWSYDKVDAEIAKFMKLPDSTRTISQFNFTTETIKHLQAVKMSSKAPKVLVDSLESCNLEEFSLICAKVESSERVMDQILQKFVAQATLNDPNEFARSASKLSAQSQAKLMKICIAKVQSLVESESSELWEVFGVFDFIAALQTAGIAKVSHLDALFEVLMREDSKFVKVFIENLGSKFENSHREIVEHYFDAIETRLKVIKGSQRRVLEDLIELLASGWKVTEDLQNQFKFEVFFSTLNDGNFDWMLMKLRKTAHDEFTELIKVLWKFLIKSPQNTKIYFKMCQSFKSLPNFRSQLDEFLTMRRRSFLRIPNEDFPPHARVKLAKVVSFIRELFHAGIVSEAHSELWTQPHLIKRVGSENVYQIEMP